MVAAVERTEEGDLERSRVLLAREQGLADGTLPLAPGHGKTPVHHLHAAVCLRRVLGGHIGHAPLETMVQPRQFVPQALVALQIER